MVGGAPASAKDDERNKEKAFLGVLLEAQRGRRFLFMKTSYNLSCPGAQQLQGVRRPLIHSASFVGG